MEEQPVKVRHDMFSGMYTMRYLEDLAAKGRIAEIQLALILPSMTNYGDDHKFPGVTIHPEARFVSEIGCVVKHIASQMAKEKEQTQDRFKDWSKMSESTKRLYGRMREGDEDGYLTPDEETFVVGTYIDPEINERDPIYVGVRRDHHARTVILDSFMLFDRFTHGSWRTEERTQSKQIFPDLTAALHCAQGLFARLTNQPHLEVIPIVQAEQDETETASYSHRL